MHQKRTLSILVAVCVFAFGARAEAQDAGTGADSGADSGSDTDSDSDTGSDSDTDTDTDTDTGAVADAPAPESTDDDEPGLSFNIPGLGRTAFSMTSTTSARYRGQNYDFNTHDDNFASLQQRLDLSLQSDEVRMELRLDGFLPFLPGITHGTTTCMPGEESLCYLEADVRPERFLLEWQHSDWKLQAGDACAIMGRGIALAFRKVDLLGVDTALRGGQVRYDGSHFHMQVVGGVANPQNLDPTDLRLIQEQRDTVVATEIGTRLGEFDDVDVALQYSRVWFRDDETGRQNRIVDVIGWHAEMPSLADGALSLYVEADGLRREYNDFGVPGREYGRAVYASAQLQVGQTTVLAEWQDYSNFMVAATTAESRAYRIYSSQPTLELEGLQRVRAIGNRRGGSLKVDYAFADTAWSVSANSILVGLNEDTTADPWDGILVSHTWLAVHRFNDSSSEPTDDAASEDDGAEQHVGWTLDALAGYRRETYLTDPSSMSVGAGDLDRQVMHGEVDASIGAGLHAFEVRVEQRYEREFVFADYNNFTQGGVTLTWSYGTHLTVSPAFRWNTEKAGLIAQRDMRDYNFIGGQYYPALEVKWTFSPGNFVSLFGGMTPGGRICSGGVCREVPPFEGVLSQLVLRL